MYNLTQKITCFSKTLFNCKNITNNYLRRDNITNSIFIKQKSNNQKLLR